MQEFLLNGSNGSGVWGCAFHSVSKTFSFLRCTKGVGSQGWSSTTLLQVSNMISFSFIAHHQGGSYPVAFRAAQWRRRATKARGLPGMRKSLWRLSLLARHNNTSTFKPGRVHKSLRKQGRLHAWSFSVPCIDTREHGNSLPMFKVLKPEMFPLVGEEFQKAANS